jgi:hypothetical protein
MKTNLARLTVLAAAAGLLIGCSGGGIHEGGMPGQIPAEGPKPPAAITAKMLEFSKGKKGLPDRSLQAAKKIHR